MLVRGMYTMDDIILYVYISHLHHLDINTFLRVYYSSKFS